MKVSELIQALSNYDEDTEVRFSYDYGDYWHTQVAPEIALVDEGYVDISRPNQYDYDTVVDEERVDDDDPDQLKVVVITGKKTYR